MKRCSVLFLLLLQQVLLASCANIIDLEDRKVGDAGVGGSTGALNCATYCTDAQELCIAAQNSEVFQTPVQCSAVCAKYAVGDPMNPTGNTLACRENLLKNARQFGEAATICQAAGPLGGSFMAGGQGCGSSCEGFCNLRQSVCPAETEPNCVAKCQGIPDPGIATYNATGDFGAGGDSLHCRMAHLATAAAYQAASDEMSRAAHCTHSGIKSTAPCDVSPDKVANCGDYCKVVMTACPDALRVYESQDQCEKVCAKFPSAPGDSATADTLRCRRVNAYAALAQNGDARSCAAAGPAPLECGGTKCAPYCTIAQTACPTQFAAKFASLDACETDCNTIPDSKANLNLSVGNGAGDTLSCRLLSVMQVVGGDPRACDSALGLVTGVCKR